MTDEPWKLDLAAKLIEAAERGEQIIVNPPPQHLPPLCPVDGEPLAKWHTYSGGTCLKMWDDLPRPSAE